MSELTFREYYQSLPVTPPKTEFIRRIARVTKKSELTVRNWIAGRQIPDALTRTIISQELKVDESVLFPSQNINN